MAEPNAPARGRRGTTAPVHMQGDHAGHVVSFTLSEMDSDFLYLDVWCDACGDRTGEVVKLARA